MKKFFAAAIWLVLGVAGASRASTPDVACGPDGSTSYVPPPGMANDTQLERIIMDYKLGTIMKASMLRASVSMDPIMGGVIDELKTSSEEDLAHVMLPALRGHLRAADAQKIAELLETDTGHRVTDYLVATVSDPLHAPPRPSLDRKTQARFQKNGGLAAFQAFSTYLQTDACKQQMMMALMHYLTRPLPPTNS